jgi:hypothetical protein
MPTCEFILDPENDGTKCGTWEGVIKVDKHNFCPKHLDKKTREDLQAAERKKRREDKEKEDKAAKDKKATETARALEEWVKQKVKLIQSHREKWYRQAEEVYEEVKRLRREAPGFRLRIETGEKAEDGSPMGIRINAGKNAFYVRKGRIDLNQDENENVEESELKKYEYSTLGGTGSQLSLVMSMDCQKYHITRYDITNPMTKWNKDGVFQDSTSARNKFRFAQPHSVEGDILVHVKIS